MQNTDRTSFQPPQPGGTGRSLALALLAHGLLLLALTWGIRWNNQPDNLSVSAELWSALPQEAAPPLQAPEPAQTPPTPPQPLEPPQPPEAVKAPEPVAPPPPQATKPDRADADIALQKEKALREKKEREDKLLKDQARKVKAEKIQEEKRQAEKAKEDKERDDREREKKKLADKTKTKAEDKAKQLAQDKKRAEEQARKEAQAQAEAEKRSEAQRQENIRRMQGLAGATGSDDAKGTALKASGPSASYAGRIRARIKPNITFNDDVDGNPKAEVEVRVAADGSIINRKLIQPSGNKAWDEAVIKAIDKTEILPRDTDGRVQPVMVISFRPKD